MEDTPAVGIAISFTAGLLSFLSPCVLPLIPSYVTFVTGLTLEDVQRSRRIALLHSLLFVLGFSLVFLALGATATTLGRMLGYNREWVGRVGGVLVIVLGLYLLGVFDFAFFSRERRLHVATKPLGYLGTVFVGMAFAAGWTPCIGPVLGAILAIAAAGSTPRAVLLLLSYSVGLGVPFLLVGLGVTKFMGAFDWVKRRYRAIAIVSGTMMVLMGVLVFTGEFTRRVAPLAQRFTLGL